MHGSQMLSENIGSHGSQMLSEKTGTEKELLVTDAF